MLQWFGVPGAGLFSSTLLYKCWCLTALSCTFMGRFVPNIPLYHTPILGSKHGRALLLHLEWYQTGCSDFIRFITCTLSTPLTAIFTRLRGMEKSHDFNVAWSVLIVIPHRCNFHLSLDWPLNTALFLVTLWAFWRENCGVQPPQDFLSAGSFPPWSSLGCSVLPRYISAASHFLADAGS